MSNKIEVNLSTINGGMDYCILTARAHIYKYENGKRVDDTVIGTRLDVVLQGNRFTPLSVRIEGDGNVLPEISDKDIDLACSTLKPVFVRFSDCKVSAYSINNNMVLSACAGSCEIINKKSS